MKKPAITVSTLTEARKKLAALPKVAPEKCEVSIKEAVILLKADIKTMRSKGYTLDQIADELSKLGIPVKPSTLKLYNKPNKAKTKSGVPSTTPVQMGKS